MTDKLIVTLCKDTDISASTVDGAAAAKYDVWTVNQIDHHVGDKIGVVVHTTMDSEFPSVAMAVRCRIRAINHNGHGVPVVTVQPDDDFTRVLELEGDKQEFVLRVNDKLVVLKNDVASPEPVEAALMQAGIEPQSNYEHGVTFEEAVSGSTHVSANGEVTHGYAVTIQGITLGGGDQLEYSPDDGATWEQRRITAVGAEKNTFFVKTTTCDAPTMSNKELMKAESIPLHYRVRGVKQDRENRAWTMARRSQLQAGTDPYREKGVLFGGAEPQPLPLAELLAMDQIPMTVMGTEVRVGDHIEYKVMLHASWHEARIDALVDNREETARRDRTSYIVALTDIEGGSFGYLKPGYYVRPVQRSRADGYSAADIDNVALIDKLMAGVGFSHVRTISVSQAHMAPASISILGIAHRKDDLIEISTNGQDWSERRINAIAFDEDTVSVAVDGAVEGDSAILLSAIWFVRPSEAMRARCLLSKRAESIPASAGAQAYAAAPGQYKSLFESDVNPYSIENQVLEGVTVGSLPIPNDLATDKPLSFTLFDLPHHQGEWIEVFYPNIQDEQAEGEWKAQRIVNLGYGADGSGFKIGVEAEVTPFVLLSARSRIRLTEARRDHAIRVARDIVDGRRAMTNHSWRAPAPVSKPVGGSPAFDRPLFREGDDNIRQTQAYLEIDQGIAVDKIPYPGFGNIAQHGQTLIGFFPFFGIDHGVGHTLEVFYPDHVQSSSGVWKEHRIVSIYYNTGPDVKCPFDITVSTGLESGTFFKLEPTARIRMLKDNREMVQHWLLKQEAEQRERMTAAWHSKVDIRFGADAGTATGASSPMSRRPNGRGLMAGSYQADVAGREFRPATGGMFTGRAFGDHPDTVAAYGVKPGPYTGKDLATHCITGGFAIQTMIRDDVKVGDFRLALLHFATEVETLVLGKPGRGFGPI